MKEVLNKYQVDRHGVLFTETPKGRFSPVDIHSGYIIPVTMNLLEFKGRERVSHKEPDGEGAIVRREVDYEDILNIADIRGTCISRRGVNFRVAQRDMEENSDRLRYYSFPVNFDNRGYARFILDKPNRYLYLDFLSPWDNPHSVKAIQDLTRNLARIDYHIVAPTVYLPTNLKMLAEARTHLDPGVVASGLNHRSYCKNGDVEVAIF